MPPKLQSVEPDVVLPKRVDVVIVGGGIIGASTALFLARSKYSVALIEKGEIAGEQSGRNQGWVRITNRDPREIPLAIEAARYWNSLNELIQADTGYRNSGAIFMADTDESLAECEGWAQKAREYQLDAKLLTNSELESLVPRMSIALKGAMYAPYDGRAEPQLAAPAIARGAKLLGAKIFTNCAVKALDITNGCVQSVVTERGRIDCDAVVIAAGAWTSTFLRRYGIDLPQLKIRSSMLKIDGATPDLKVNTFTSKFLVRKRQDGGYTVASTSNHVADIVPDNLRYFKEFIPLLRRRWNNLPMKVGASFFEELSYTRRGMEKENGVFERYRNVEPVPRVHQNLEAVQALKNYFPDFSSARISQHWSGLVDVVPDEVPVISKAEVIKGLVITTGFSGHGFGVGPAAGKLTADLITGQSPIVAPSDFRLARFQDGSWQPTKAIR